MTKTVKEKLACSECGSEAKSHALYCFHCGSSLRSENSESIEGNEEVREKSKSSESEPGRIPMPGGIAAKELHEMTTEVGKDRSDAGTTGSPKMRTASALRRYPSILRMRRIEVRWESKEEGPNIWFIVFALALSILVFVVFLLSMYLR